MARARNIKPGFFRNADLVELPYEARLLFIGLWTIADRAGRMEDRPKQIKMELFPADSLDVDSLLDQLASIGMVARYSHEGKRYLQVVNFVKHQNPHKDEKASTLPDQDGHVAHQEPEKKKHRADTVQAPCESGADTVAIGLIPDSLIPDSPIPDNTPDGVNGVAAVSAPAAAPAVRKRSAPPPTKPDDVEQQTWDDWLSLRTKKRASVSLTVVDEARAESVKAGLTLDRFLRIWCLRGSQGLQADWLKPAELQRFGRDAGVETFAQQAARERMEEIAPMVARQAPGRSAFDNAQRFMDGEVIDVTPARPLSLAGGRHG